MFHYNVPHPCLELASEEGGRMQAEELRLEKSHSIRRLKIIFADGYDHFAAVYSVHATG